MTYEFLLEGFAETYPELERLYRMHYAEMQARLDAQGVPIGPYNPRLDRYEAAEKRGDLLTFVVRFDGKAVGYSNVFITRDMHNSVLISQEDTIFVEPAHRNGIGKKLVAHILGDLKARGVKRVQVQAMTDLRVAKLWARMGFRPAAETMIYIF